MANPKLALYSETNRRDPSNRMWRLPEPQRELAPLMYSLLAFKPEG